MLKPIIALLSLGLGAGAAGLVVELQANPQLLITAPAQQSQSLTAALTLRPLAPATAVAAPQASHVVVIDEVTVVGQPPVHRATTWHRALVATNTPKPPPTALADKETRVIAPPCVDGEYRQIEEHRGVRLTCFGSQSQSQ